MKGIIFNLLEQAVTRQHGEVTWNALLEAANVEGAYTSLGNYPDDELLRLVAAASAALNIPPEAVIRWFGRSAIPQLVHRYPMFFAGHTSTQPFLLTLNDVIHTEVRKLYPGADVPDFDFGVASGDRLELGYRSHRKLCALAEGLIEGAAAHYGESAVIEQPRCMNRGDDKCLLVCSFTKRNA